jgi:hypothetical protein
MTDIGILWPLPFPLLSLWGIMEGDETVDH